MINPPPKPRSTAAKRLSSKLNPAPDECIHRGYCKHGHELPPAMSTKRALPYAHAMKTAASLLRTRGRQFKFDYNASLDKFMDEGQAIYEEIIECLVDISEFQLEFLSEPVEIGGKRGCEKMCHKCPQCIRRRRGHPDTQDLEDLQAHLRRLFDITYQNFFHRIVAPDRPPNSQDALVTPLHRVFMAQEAPEDAERSLAHFERHGSGDTVFPLPNGASLPKGCPAALCLRDDQEIIDDFIDRVLCKTQNLHEKHKNKLHYTTELKPITEYCQICDGAAWYLLPALVAPYFAARQESRLSLIAKLLTSPGLSPSAAYLANLQSAPMVFPDLPCQPPPLPSLKPQAPPLVSIPNPYEPLLMPLQRPRFKPARNPDPVRQPFSYFLGLDPFERLKHLRARVDEARRTRSKDRSNDYVYEPVEKVESGEEWVCKWIVGSDVHIPLNRLILEDDEVSDGEYGKYKYSPEPLEMDEKARDAFVQALTSQLLPGIAITKNDPNYMDLVNQAAAIFKERLTDGWNENQKPPSERKPVAPLSDKEVKGLCEVLFRIPLAQMEQTRRSR